MKTSGQLLSLIGIVLAIYSLFFMDVSVDVGDGTRVNNIGLMAQQQNYLLVAVVLFLAGVFISFTRKKKLPEVDFSKIESLSSEDFISEKNGEIFLNVLAIDNFSLMLLKKHGSSSMNDILFMNMPLIDRLEKGLPEAIRKDFRSTLKNRLKENV